VCAYQGLLARWLIRVRHQCIQCVCQATWWRQHMHSVRKRIALIKPIAQIHIISHTHREDTGHMTHAHTAPRPAHTPKRDTHT